MPPTSDEAARNYRAALLALAQHEEARTLAAQSAQDARSVLAALDPAHALLRLDPSALGASLSAVHMQPLHVLVELFLSSPYEPARRLAPETALLAGSLAVTRTRTTGAPPVAEVLRRVLDAVRQPVLGPEV